MAAPNYKERRRRGGQCRLTPELREKICESITVAVPFKYACEAQGVSESTGLNWMRWGEEGKKTLRGVDPIAGPYESDFVAFLEAVLRARAACVENYVVRAQADGAMGARWTLEKRFPKEFGNRQQIDHTLLGGELNSNEPEGELARKLAAWKRAVLADDLPPRRDSVGDSGPEPTETGTG